MKSVGSSADPCRAEERAKSKGRCRPGGGDTGDREPGREASQGSWGSQGPGDAREARIIS